MKELSGLRIAVAGLGRSGMGVALAANSRGAKVSVFDEHSGDNDRWIAQAERLQGQSIEVVSGWHGRLQPEFDLLVSSPGFRREHPAHRDAAAHGIQVLSEVEFAYWISKAPIVAVTGTNGKTTVTLFTMQLLKGAGIDAVLCGNISGSGFEELTLTEAADRSTPEQVLVAEISSYQLEWTSEFRPKVASITNITPDHLDRYSNFEDYADTKLKIFAAMGEGDTALVNTSDTTIERERLLEAIPQNCKVREYSTAAGTDPDTHSRSRRVPGYLILDNMQIDTDLIPVKGEHNYWNLIQAWEAATAFLGDQQAAARDGMLGAITSLQLPRYRMEPLGEREGVIVINSSMTTNPVAAVTSSKSLALRQHLLMGGNTKGLDFATLREYLQESNHSVYLFGQDSIARSDSSLAKQLPEFEAFGTLEDAFKAAVANAVRGEAIVLLPGCLSAYPYENFRERGDAFNLIAKSWLEQK